MTLGIPKLEFLPIAHLNDIQIRAHHLYHSFLTKSTFGKETLDRLSKDERVINLKGEMVNKGNGSHAFSIEDLAMWFLYQANEVGVDIAELQLNTFLDAEKVATINTLWVLGIKIDTPITLANGFEIISIEEMPDSREKEYFLQFDTHGIPLRTPKPTAAIIHNCEQVKAGKLDLKEYHERSAELYDIALLLNSIDAQCFPYMHTAYHPPNVPFGLFGGSTGSSEVRDVIGYTTLTPLSDQQAIIQELIDDFNKLNEDDKNRFRRILERLSQSKRRHQIEDKMLDLGIALEMLLLKDNSKNEQLSLSFRLRGSWLISNDAEERKKNYDSLKMIYNLRSEVAHSGLLSRKSFEIAREKFSEYQLLAESTCRRMLKNPNPNWDGMILGGTSPPTPQPS